MSDQGEDFGGCGCYLLAVVGIVCVAPVALVVGTAALAVVGTGFAVYYVARVMAEFFLALHWSLNTREEEVPEPRRKLPELSDTAPQRGYFGGMARNDHALAVGLCRTRIVDFAEEEAETLIDLFDRDWTEAVPLLPVSLGRSIALAAGLVVGGSMVALLLAVHTAVVAAFAATAVASALALRGLDRLLLTLRHIRMSCPFCFERINYPRYRCRDCARLHRDIRNWRHGVLTRTCSCGARMPTMILLGAAQRLDAACPSCERELAHRPGQTREFILPLFGAAGAGKTRLMRAIHSVLERAAEGEDAELEYGDTETRDQFRATADRLEPDRMMQPTPKGRDPRGLVLRFSAAQRTLLLQLYDVAGENFDRSETTQPLTYFGKADTFLLVIDPLAVKELWEALAEPERVRLAGYRSRNVGKELAYQQTYLEIERQYAVRKAVLKSARLAIVITRADLLDTTSAARRDGQSAKDWARDALRLGNVLQSAENVFGDYEVFHTAAVVRDDGPDPSLNELLAWVLRKEAPAFQTALAAPPRTSSTAERAGEP